MINIVSADFIKGAVNAAGFPSLGLPEFAFFGRSNVGKSSLINTITNRKSLVKTGSRPGMTRQINFFKINNQFVLTDLPGYGYAQRSGQENEAFDRMLAQYAQERQELKTIFFLMDMRRLPTQVEADTVAYFENLNIEVILVGTKADKLSSNELVQTKKKWAVFFNRSTDLLVVSSASKKTGRSELLKLIADRL